jgi:hypothetical protein
MIKARKRLSFDYCECGWNGFSAGAGSNSFWIYWDLAKIYYLIEGHGWTGLEIGKYSTFNKAINEATKRFKANLKSANNCLIDKK